MLYIPARNHGGSPNLPCKRIVIHGTASPCEPGEALKVAHMFATTTRDASTQKVHDPTTTVRCVPDNVIAYGAPPNTGSLHHELCDPQAGPASRWQDSNHQAMLRIAALDVANDCRTYSIPVRKIGALQLRLGVKGICGHVDVSNAWHQTTHVDPGPDFPWAQFLALVKAALKNPTPAPTPGGTAMITQQYVLVRETGTAQVYLGNGIIRRKVIDPRDLEVTRYNMAKRWGSPDLKVYDMDAADLESYGVLVDTPAPAPTA